MEKTVSKLLDCQDSESCSVSGPNVETSFGSSHYAKPPGMKSAASGKPSRAEMLAYIDQLKDEDIDTSDSPTPTPEMWAKGRVRDPRPKEQIALRVDVDLLEWFKAQGPGYQTRMNAVLRMYMTVQNAGGR